MLDQKPISHMVLQEISETIYIVNMVKVFKITQKSLTIT